MDIKQPGFPPEINPTKNMSPFHSGLNHWQRQWLSDRLHKKNQNPPPAQTYFPIPVAKPKPAKKSTPRQKPAGEI
jgi:hypothetical protein